MTNAREPDSVRPPTITVSGIGRVAIRPDLADLRLGVTITAATVKAAREQSATAMHGILAGLRALGVAERDLRTAIVSVSPAYDYSSNTNPPRLTGYTFSNLVDAVVRDIDVVGDAIDAALGAGATNVDRLAFRVADPEPAEREARAAAVRDARSKAETIAAAAGVALGEALAIVEGGGPVPYPMPHAEMAVFKARDAGTPVEAGEHEISVTVGATYRIS